MGNICTLDSPERLGQFLPRLIGRPLSIVVGGAFILFWLGGAVTNVTVFALRVRHSDAVHPVTALVAASALIIVLVSLSGLKTLVRVTDALLPPGAFLLFALFGHSLEAESTFPTWRR